MTKRVHPNVSFKGCVASINDAVDYKSTSCKDDGVVALTVWRKSLLLNCKGFTVFDCNGNIVFRVDNYVAANKGEILLMDAHGKPLLTIRRKKLSWGDNWQIYEGESCVNPRYLVQKQGNLLSNNTKNMNLAQVQLIPTKAHHQKVKNDCKETTLYHIEGSYAQRSVVIYNNTRQCVAEIKKKEAPNGVTLGGDVFKLIIVRPSDIDCALAMALVILLDQMFGSS
ncbi:hypothetical protein RND81_05G027300 [Saponaria officinalis]|uniref:Protein LURP-one-related 8 n=1 Tax=Saponaria officinalis TaxID=3572 RepID=A0AAW1KU62_SAPOF